MQQCPAVPGLPPNSPDAPRVSIVIPVFNEEGILHEAVNELCAELDRSGWTYEIILAENGSHRSHRRARPSAGRRAPGRVAVLASRAELRQRAARGHPRARAAASSSARRSTSATPTSTGARSSSCGTGDADMVVGSKAMKGANDEPPAGAPRRDPRDQRRAARRARFPRHRHPRAQGVRRASGWCRSSNSCVIDRDLFASELVVRAGRARLRVVEIPVRVHEKRRAGDQPRRAACRNVLREPRPADLRDPDRRQSREEHDGRAADVRGVDRRRSDPLLLPRSTGSVRPPPRPSCATWYCGAPCRASPSCSRARDRARPSSWSAEDIDPRALGASARATAARYARAGPRRPRARQPQLRAPVRSRALAGRACARRDRAAATTCCARSWPAACRLPRARLRPRRRRCSTSSSRLGYRYDSSIFPAPGYYAAKALRHGRDRARDRPSQRRGARPTRARCSRRPRPYRPSRERAVAARRGADCSSCRSR